jgi:hypothetical protein
MRRVMRMLRRFRHEEDDATAAAARAEESGHPEPTFHFEFESVEGQLIYPSDLPPPPGFNGNGAGAPTGTPDEELSTER